MKARITVVVLVMICLAWAAPVPETVGFRMGEVSGYKLLGKHSSSSLY